VIDILLEAEQALALGFLDKAEKLFRQVATNDPRSAIAVVGLARVALERGRDAEALDLVRQARAIDPENPTALRLEARLVEVAAYREGTGARVAPGAATPTAASPPSVAQEPARAPAPTPTPARRPTPPPARPPSSKRRPGLLGRLLGRR
jgi:tetratricopeptide (TPR) repeat protein